MITFLIHSIPSRLTSLLLCTAGLSLFLTWRNSIHPGILANGFPNKAFTSRSTTTITFRPSRFTEPTSAQASISLGCTEMFISSGRRCANTPRPQPIDLVWTWVNQSNTPEEPMGEEKAAAYLYRQHDELKFSLRSSLESLPSDYIHSRILLTADKYLISPVTGRYQHWISRPLWLRTPRHPRVILQHHSQIFKFIPSPLAFNQSHWLQNYVPSHNSLAIESQFGHLSGIKNHFMYLNDDCFFINKFGEGDFTSELLGPVFRIQFDLNVDQDTLDRSGTEEAKGEWPSLSYSNYLLNMRFGSRSRRYINHVAKVSNIHMMREVSEIWEEEIFWTASSRFRGQRREINMMFLTTWYQIEKQREALLHSFVMLKSDSNQDGTLSDDEWADMIKDVVGDQGSSEEDVVRVFKPFRPRPESIEEILGDYAPLQTDYQWLSSDGYPLIDPKAESIPDYQTQESEGSRKLMCELNIKTCFPQGYRRTEDLMRWISSERPECGDCLIAQLVGKRPAGLEAFLPPASLRTQIAKLWRHQTVYRNSFSSSHKDLKLVRFYSDRRSRSSRLFPGSFLTDDPRMWAIRNLQRYQYVLGNTPSDFQALTTTLSSRKILKDLSNKLKLGDDKQVIREVDEEKGDSPIITTPRRKLLRDGLLVTLNDRIVDFQLESVHNLFKNWLFVTWPSPAPWEILS